MSVKKHILMVATGKKLEALRMGSGLTLLDDPLSIAVWGSLPEGPEVDEQMGALEFSEIEVKTLGQDFDGLASCIMNSDVVYFV